MADPNELRTSSIQLISSLHGRQRRLERDISIKDLQTAVKYGVKVAQFGYKNRFKITYNNIVYITDETCTKEVTSYAATQLPLEHYIIDDTLSRQITEQIRRLNDREVGFTSHTVIIVDQSTSMNEGDVMGHRSRSRCAYYAIANEMIAQLLIKDQVCYTDIVTIIEMRVELSQQPLRGKGHGNYIPALTKASEVLSSSDNPDLGLALLFMSDGRPSDQSYLRKGESIEQAILLNVVALCQRYKDRLTFAAFGFAYNDDKFALMKSMVEIAKLFGCQGVFSTGLDTPSLRKALYKMSTSLMSTKSNLSSLAGGSILNTDVGTRVERQDFVQDTDRQNIDEIDDKFNKGEYDLYFIPQLERYIPRSRQDAFVRQNLMHPNAKGIAIKKLFIEKGAERVAFETTEIDIEGNPLGKSLVAKVSKHHERDQLKFHETCALTQLEARRLSKKFNDKLDSMKLKVPKISFLSVSFYVINGYSHEGPEDRKSYLVENRLDRFKKFNDNRGGVVSLNQKLDNIQNDVDISDDEEEVSEKDENDEIVELSDELLHEASRIIDDDVPQTFSHWSYVYTKGELLVCDLQGALGSKEFSLTDPAINSDIKGRFGKTDMGRKGQKRFFKTHKCTSFCRVLKIENRLLKFWRNS